MLTDFRDISWECMYLTKFATKSYAAFVRLMLVERGYFKFYNEVKYFFINFNDATIENIANHAGFGDGN